MAKVAKRKTKARAKKRPNGAKAKPTDQFGFRSGSLKSKAASMFGSKNGATLGEVKAALKSTQFNLLTELEEKKYKIKRILEAGKGARKVTRYHIVA